jgi:hypothetical protein
VDPEPLNLPLHMLIPTAESARLMHTLGSLSNLDELLEAYSPAQLAESEVDKLSYLVGREYETVEIFEIGDETEGFAFPYMVVTAAGTKYGSEDMGLGELALHLTNWHLSRVPENSILLLEEPETHISPRSQHTLLNILAEYATDEVFGPFYQPIHLL